MATTLILLLFFSSVEKDESVLRSYLSELQSIKSHLQEAEQKLMIGMQMPPPSGVSGEGVGTAVHIAEHEVCKNRFNSCIFWRRNSVLCCFILLFFM